MLPILIDFGPIKVYSYGLMIAVGFLISLNLIRRDATRKGFDPDAVETMVLWTFFWGLAGTRVLYIIMFPEGYSWSDPIGWIAIWRGGLVFQGAVPPAIIFCFFYLRKKKMNFRKTADLVFPYLPLGHAFGRMGCFLNGCCYGARTDVPWGVCFRRVPWDITKEATGSPAFLDHARRYADISLTDHWSHPVHPTQLYSVFALLFFFVVMFYVRKRWHPFDGFLMPLYFVMYGIFRFFVEFLRGDHNPTHFGSLSDQQIFCILFVLFALGLFVYFKVTARKPASSAE